MNARIAWAVGWGVGLGMVCSKRHRRCLQAVCSRDKMGTVERMRTSRPVLVDAAKIDDLTELARMAAAELERLDPALANALRGALAEVRVSMVVDTVDET